MTLPVDLSVIRNLNSADRLIKLTLSVSVVVLYLIGIISGPEGIMLLILSCGLLAVYLAKTMIELSKKD